MSLSRSLSRILIFASMSALGPATLLTQISWMNKTTSPVPGAGQDIRTLAETTCPRAGK